MIDFSNQVLVLCVIVLFGGTAQAQFTFQKIADTNTAVPGSGSGTFNNFELQSATIDEGQVAFESRDGNLDQGIYLFNGVTLSEVVFRGDSIPDVPGASFQFSNDDTSIEVIGGVATVGIQAILDVRNTADNASGFVVYTETNGVATNHADNITTLSPSTGTVFQSVSTPGIFGGAVAFNGNVRLGSGTQGIYTDATGTLTTVADPTTPVPGLPTYSFESFGFDVSFEGNIGFDAVITDGSNDAIVSVVATPAGALTIVANTIDTLSPSTNNVFAELDEPAVDGTNYVFGADDGAFGSGFEGIYANYGSGLFTIADEGTTVPGQGANLFTAFDDDTASIDGNRIVFEGKFAGGEGLYLWDDGTLLRIIDTTQLLDGKVLTDLDLAFDSALSGDQIVFVASFNDGSEGVFIATIPEPASLALLGLSGLMLTRRRSR